jgi:O-antigen chain-terminating methyltransferase
LDENNPDLLALRRRLEEEEAAYESFLAAVDALASFPLPAEKLTEMPWQMGRLNALWEGARRPEGTGFGAGFRRRAWDAVAPALDMQREFNSILVQLLNGQVDETTRLHAHLRSLMAALVRYLQRLLPLVDARDRMASALATTRAELILETFDRRLEALGRRLEGLTATADRLEVLSAQVRALRATLEEAAPPPAVAASAREAVADSVYAAFENRFRGSSEELRERLSAYVDLFRDLSPVAELGCGRGEFLELLRSKGITSRGVECNAHLVRECRERGLEVVQGDLLDFLRGEPPASLGGVFAAQVAEHLPPAVLQSALAAAHRALRPGGLLVIETVNPRSLVGFLEVYNRDLTHERPLHPDTLSFLAAASGFGEVRVELRSPVDPAERLQPVPVEGLPERAARALNENVERLNDFLYAPREYALIARR